MSEQVGTYLTHKQVRRRPIPARGLLASAFGVLTLVAGCSDTTVDRWSYTEAVIEGQLSDPNGVPVRDASVDVFVFRDACGDTRDPATLSFLRSDEAGRFDARIRSLPTGVLEACLSIRVRAPTSSLRDTVVTGYLVTFRTPAPDVLLDTVRVDIRLSPAGR